MTDTAENAIEMKTPPKSRRRWFRYSMRTLLILVTISSCAIGLVGKRIREIQREQPAIAWVQKQEGIVRFKEPRGWSLDKWTGTNAFEVELGITPVSAIIDLSPLAELKNLHWLSLSSTSVSDLSPLVELKNLEGLDLGFTPVSDLSPLAELKNLHWLSLSSTSVSDLSPLAKLENLEYLFLKGTQVSNLTPLAKLENLESLSLDDTPVSDLSPLAKLENLLIPARVKTDCWRLG